MLQAALQRGNKLAACVSEAVRLQAPGMDVRIAAADLQLPSRSGHVHTICKVIFTYMLCPARQLQLITLAEIVRDVGCFNSKAISIHAASS